jgi:hypothetical protein
MPAVMFMSQGLDRRNEAPSPVLRDATDKPTAGLASGRRSWEDESFAAPRMRHHFGK